MVNVPGSAAASQEPTPIRVPRRGPAAASSTANQEVENNRAGRPRRAPMLILLVAAALSGCSDPPAEPHTVNAAFDAEMRQTGGSPYVVPSGDELSTVQQAMGTLCRDQKTAAQLLAPLGYAITQYHDEALGGRTVQVVHEAAEGPRRHGWGWYLINCASPEAPVIEVPHPVSDEGTARLGFDIFARGHAGALLVAGSTRGPDGAPSDVAHAPSSVFLTVHEQLATEGREVLQVHGFAKENHDDLSDQAVVSPGSVDPAVAGFARKISDALRAAGVSVCEFGADDSCSDLGATENVEGMASRAAGAQFAHLELDEFLRGSPDVVVRAVDEALAE